MPSPGVSPRDRQHVDKQAFPWHPFQFARRQAVSACSGSPPQCSTFSSLGMVESTWWLIWLAMERSCMVGIGWAIFFLHTNRLRKCFSHLRLSATILLLPSLIRHCNEICSAFPALLELHSIKFYDEKIH